jgi:hypothetical protein
MPVRYGHCGIIGASVLSALKVVAPGHRPVHGGRKNNLQYRAARLNRRFAAGWMGVLPPRGQPYVRVSSGGGHWVVRPKSIGLRCTPQRGGGQGIIFTLVGYPGALV